jgi:hypothetical protein
VESGQVLSTVDVAQRSINAKSAPYNAKGDWFAPSVDAAAMTAASAVLTVTSYAFTAADVGKRAVVKGAGAAGALLSATILSVASGLATLSVTASTTVTGKAAAWGSDDTAALNAAFAAAAVRDNDSRAVWVPAGWYRFDQLVIPSGVAVRGAGWGKNYGTSFGLKNGPDNGTLLQQLEGAEKHGVIFTEQFHQVAGTFYFIGPLQLEDLEVQGPYTGTTGDGIYCGVAGPLAGTPQDGFRLKNIHVIGFPGNGFTFPKGCLPLAVQDCRAFYNGGYGLSYDGQGASQGAHLIDFSGDGNGLGLTFWTGLQSSTADGPVVIDNMKSEMVELVNLGGNSIERAQTGLQPNAMVIDNCTAAFLINGLVHISAAKDRVADSAGTIGQAPGPAIVIQNGGFPTIRWNAVGVRISNTGTDTHQSDSVLIRDSNQSVDVPRSFRHGFYSGRTPADPEAVLGVRPRRLTSKGGTYVEALSGFESPGDQMQGETPSRSWYETDGTAQSKHYLWAVSGGHASLRAVDDDGLATEVLVDASRTTGKVSSVLVGSATVGAKIGFYGGTARSRTTNAPSLSSLLAALGSTAGIGLVDDTATGAITVQETCDRRHLSSLGSSLTSGRIVFSYFQADSALAAGHVLIPTGTTLNTAAGAGALIRAGLYSVAANGTLTQLASTTNDVAAMSTANSEVSKALSATVTFVPGGWYAYGLLVVSTAMPNTVAAIAGSAAQGAGGNGRHRLAGFFSGQTDLPADAGTIASGSISNTGNMPYAAFIA